MAAMASMAGAGRWQWISRIAAVLTSLMLIAGVVLTWRGSSSSAKDDARLVARTTLQNLWARQQSYYRLNLVYTSDIRALGITPGTGGWHYSTVTARLENEQRMLIEARSDTEGMAIGEKGELLRSTTENLPLTLRWKPPEPPPTPAPQPTPVMQTESATPAPPSGEAVGHALPPGEAGHAPPAGEAAGHAPPPGEAGHAPPAGEAAGHVPPPGEAGHAPPSGDTAGAFKRSARPDSPGGRGDTP